MEDSLTERFVYICSPYRADTEEEWAWNIQVAEALCKFAIRKKKVPIAPHLYFPQFLDDSDAEQRELGMAMGLAMLEDCSEVWVSGDRISEGMAVEIARANELEIPIRIKHVFKGGTPSECF